MAGGDGRSDPLGLQSALERRLKAQGDISLDDFEASFSPPGPGRQFLDRVSFDVRSARHWRLLDADVDDHNRAANAGSWGPRRLRSLPTRLSAQAMAQLENDGFVVSDVRLASFGDAFLRIYSDDLPVWVGADAMLHAWHRTYDEMLVHLEERWLAPALGRLLEGMRGAVAAAAQSLGATVLHQGVHDADYFLTVAAGLMNPKQPFAQVASVLGHDQVVGQTLAAIEAGQLTTFELFGTDRMVDFSQFKPRGHYTRSEALRRYFRAMMWCGRVELRMRGKGGARELGAAVAMVHLLRESGEWEAWGAFSDALEALVGKTDSMTFRQLEAVLRQYCTQ
eukprot:evm.model.scf_1580EXC.2 EVM.evm.TU.scf_1580EXC.2   scf_1580EXC:32233-33240(+)